MGATKIINILKDDQFEDVLDAFKKTQAEEVIFIMPKNTKLGKKEEHFASLAKEAKDSQKQITIMTADQKIEQYANKYGFKFLAQVPKVKVKKTITKKYVADEPEEKEEETEENVHPEEKEDAPEEKDKEDIDTYEHDDENWVANDEKDKEDEPEDDGAEAEPVMAELSMARAKSSRKPTSPDKRVQKLESIWLKREASEKIFKKPSKNFRGKNLNLVFLSAGALILLIAVFAFLGNAQVIIKPQKQKLDFELPVTVSTNTAQVDPTANKLPGQLLSFKADASKDFSSTGQQEVVKKARGEITVYNNFNSDPQNLVATTRFESSKGLIFRIPRSITIPGAKLVSGKLTPGSITVEVIADKAGPEYNINADRFTIPGFANTPKFNGFYAESNQPMSGGMTGLSKIVTENDFNSAKEIITKEVLSKSLESLKNKKADLEVVEPINNEIVSLKSTAQADDAVEGFAISAVSEAKTIAFSKDDLLQVIEAFVNKSGNLVLLKDSLTLDYKNAKFDFEKNNLAFTVNVKGEAAAKIDQDKILDHLAGLKQNQIKDYLLSFKEIESARVILSPFWVRTVPKNKQDIHVKIVY